MSQRPYPFEALRPKIDYNELVWTLFLNIANSLNSMGFESENRGTHGTTIGTSSPIIPFERFSAYVMILQKTILQKWRDLDYENEIAKYARPKGSIEQLLVWTLFLNIANSLNSMGFESENRGTHGTTIGTSSPIIPFERFSAYVMILQKTILQKWRDLDYENEIAKYARPKGSIEQLFDWS